MLSFELFLSCRTYVRVPNTMKHVCVAARIGDGKTLGAANVGNLRKTSNAASRGGRSRFQALYAWMRPRSATLGAPIPRDSRAPLRSHPRRGPLLHAPVRRRSWLQPFGLARVLARCSPVLGERSFGAETGSMRCRTSLLPGARAPFPQAGLRLTSHGASLSQATGLE